MHTASIIGKFWHDQIAEHDRQGEFLVLISFLASFLFIRTSARMTRSVSWWPGGVETEGGVHLHHLVWGICLVLVSGVLSRFKDIRFILSHDPILLHAPIVALEGHRAAKGNGVS